MSESLEEYLRSIPSHMGYYSQGLRDSLTEGASSIDPEVIDSLIAETCSRAADTMSRTARQLRRTLTIREELDIIDVAIDEMVERVYKHARVLRVDTWIGMVVGLGLVAAGVYLLWCG